MPLYYKHHIIVAGASRSQTAENFEMMAGMSKMMDQCNRMMGGMGGMMENKPEPKKDEPKNKPTP
jgi:hypothetical protein